MDDPRNNRASLVSVLVLLFSVLVQPVLGTGVIELATEGDLEGLREALGKKPELINTTDSEGRTLLYLACGGNHLAVVKLLVAEGADVNATTRDGNGPLHLVAYRNLGELMQVLLEKKAKLNPINHMGSTPLHYAALADATAAVSMLVAAGADTEIKDDYGRTPLVLGARERGGPETIKLLIDGGAEIDVKDRFGDGALELAAWRGKTEVVGLLLDAGAKLPSGGEASRKLFGYAADAGLTRLFQSLVKAGGDPSYTIPSGGTLVHSAAAGGSLEILQSLVKRGLDLNGTDDYGWTPLHYAARDGRVECASWLARSKAKLNARTIAGQTAYNVAREREMAPVAELLKEAGADTGPIRFPTLEGPYLGQKPPGDEPQRFATGIVSSIWGLHSSIAFSPDGDLALWSPMVDVPGEIYSRGYILMMSRRGGVWTYPRLAPFTEDGRGDVAFFAPGGERVYFLSRHTLPDETESQGERIWYSDRKGETWSAARLVDPAVNDFPQHWQLSVDRNHSIYFSANRPDGLGKGDIYRAEHVDGRWLEPVNLGAPVNSAEEEATPFIAADGSYLLIQRAGDLFISYRLDDTSWSEPRNLGQPINSSDSERCPIVSPDGRYLFFVSSRHKVWHIFWVAADFIERLRPRPEEAEKDGY